MIRDGKVDSPGIAGIQQNDNNIALYVDIIDTCNHVIVEDITSCLTKHFDGSDFSISTIDSKDNLHLIRVMRNNKISYYAETLLQEIEGGDPWISVLSVTIIKNLDHPQFSVKLIADLFAISDRQLRRRVSQITGLSTKQFINKVRFIIAKDLVQNYDEISFQIISSKLGFTKKSYFLDQFQKRYGYRPSLR